MTVSSIERQGFVLVANGALNPAIFHPSWFHHHGVISADELNAAEIEVTHREMAQFSIPGFKFDVQDERFVIHASRDPFIRALDFFLEIFGHILPETPISSVGINYYAHVSLSSWEKRQKLGRALAPIEPWGEFGQRMESNDYTEAGGLTSLTMRAMMPGLGKESQTGVTIQPSAEIKTPDGIYIIVNHHFKPDKELRAPQWCELLASQFDDATLASRNLIKHVTEFAESL